MNMVTNVTAANFDSEVLEASEPVLVDFWAPWCGPCLRQSPELEAISVEFDGQVKVVKVNVDRNADLTLRFSVRGIPNLVLFKDGKPVERIIGLTPRAKISTALHRHLAS